MFKTVSKCKKNNGRHPGPAFGNFGKGEGWREDGKIFFFSIKHLYIYLMLKTVLKNKKNKNAHAGPLIAVEEGEGG